MELNGYLRLIWSSKRWLLLFAVVAAVVVYAISASKEDQYESTALGQIVSTSQAEGEILSEEQLLSLSNVYHELANTSTVLDLAHQEPEVKGREGEFNSSVEVSPESRVGVLSFTAITGDPTVSAEFANAYAKAFSEYLSGLQVSQVKEALAPIQQRINEIETELNEIPAGELQRASLQVELQALQEQIASQTSNPGDSLRIVERAGPNPNAVAPKPKRDAILAFIVALILGACVIYLRDLLFDRYGSAQDASRDLGLQLLGEIPKTRGGEPALEAFRSLRTAMVFALERSGNYQSNGAGSGAGTVLITGAESGCGKSYVSANISRTLATEGRRVTAVDGDLRRPTLHEVFRTSLSPGLSDLLVEDPPPPPESVAVNVRLTQSAAAPSGELQIVPAGAHAEDAVESLSSSRMKEVVRFLRSDNDMVVFDSPPTLVVVDPVVLARYADGVVFVIDSRHTRRRDARRAIEALRATGAPLLGFAFNRSNAKQTRYDAYRPANPQQPAGRPKETQV
ncbi:MAG TPA: P-loop NTPase [Solirubrobacterales bacterium]|nr:P-loop NTPase [Solirubrobacterales bacterium]